MTPLPSWLDLRSASAIVTGGGTHIGLAMATALGELGATVFLVGRRESVVREAAATLTGAGVQATALPGDAADERSMERIVGEVVARHGHLDIMVCNAGGAQGNDQAPGVTLHDLEATLRRNIGTTLVAAEAAATAMIEAGRGGAIITVGSIHGTLGSDRRRYAPGFRRSPVSYHAAKGGVVNLTRALACELAEHDITVNCVSPGQVPKAGMDAETRERQRDGIPLGRVGTPDDLRGAVALFASPAGSWITGQNLTVDGGWSAW